MFNKELRMCHKCERIVPEKDMFKIDLVYRLRTTKICQRCANMVGDFARRDAMILEANKFEVNLTDLPEGKVTGPVPRPRKR